MLVRRTSPSSQEKSEIPQKKQSIGVGTKSKLKGREFNSFERIVNENALN